MKARVIQVVWHGKDPVFTLDFHPGTNALFTGGADKEVKARNMLVPSLPKGMCAA
jgi:chromatin assembly factor 1 subunit B